MNEKVIVTTRRMAGCDPSILRPLERAGLDWTFELPANQSFAEGEMRELVKDATGLILGDDVVSARVLEEAHSLKAIVKWGIGTDSIDRDALARRQIGFRNTPDVFGQEVADYALGFLLLLARGQHVVHEQVRAGLWPQPVGWSLSGRTLGVVGLGSSGRELCARAAAFGLRVIGTDIREPPSDWLRRVGCEFQPDVDSLLGAADIVSLHVPLTPDTHHLINRSRLRLLAPDGYLINTSRGHVVDEGALVEALDAGNLGGAALDVFEQEPLPLESPLRNFPNVILGAHNASNTREAVNRASERAVGELIELMERG